MKSLGWKDTPSTVPKELVSINKEIKEILIIDQVVGVYFLYAEKELIYIGQSVDVINRIKSHNLKKKFNRVLFFECNAKDLNQIEGALIRHFQPFYNFGNSRTYGKKRLIAPVRAWNDDDDLVLKRLGIIQQLQKVS